MLREQIEQLGLGAFERVISPLAKVRSFDGLVVGFDTEYTSRTQEPLCFQLSDGGARSYFYGRAVSPARLAAALVRDFGVQRGDEVCLVSYFSIAELQHLPVKRASFAWREYGTGSLDCSFLDERSGVTLHIFDLARFFDKQGLAAVASAFGLEKLDFDTSRVTRASLKSARFREYAVRDAWLCGAIVRKLREQFAPWAVDPIQEKTAASTAAAVFRRGWVSEPIQCENNSARLAGMRACWGGHAEAYARGLFDGVSELDIKSAYPRAAIELGTMPDGKTWREVSTLRQLERCVGGFALVDFSFPEEEQYPCLPVVLREAQLYPLRGREWVTFSEVSLALRLGASVRIVEGWGYTGGTRILRDYMEEILEKRSKAQGAERVALKLLANSLIGKFAQRVSEVDLETLRKFSESEGVLLDDLACMSREELQALGLGAMPRVGAVFHPEWNALITGYTRAEIADLARSTRALYVATDAVWTQHPPKKPPAWLDLKRFGRAVVARTRLGMIEEDGGAIHCAHHSIWNRKAAIQLLANLEAGKLTYSTRRPLKLRESLRKGERFGKWIEEKRVANAKWDGKRKLYTDGRTSPWRSVDDFREWARVARKFERQA